MYIIWILFGLICVTITEDVRPFAPPVPGIPINTDPTEATSKTASTPAGPPKLSQSYLPAVMQAIAYYVELIQYEPLQTTTLEPPFTGDATDDYSTQSNVISTSTSSYFTRPTTQWKPATTTTTTTTTTTKRPTTTAAPWWVTLPSTTTTTTTRRTPSVPWYIEQTTHTHYPGYFAPVTPPSSNPEVFHYEYEIPLNSINNYAQPAVNQQQSVNKPQTGNLPILSISNNQFFDWFFQTKPKDVEGVKINDYNLQYLNQLPAGLLQDIEAEQYEQPTLLDVDNVNEFLKVYDDFYGVNRPITGKKKTPPTRPYVQMLMLYDLLKREAKKLMLNTFEGYTPEMIAELHETTKGSAERQLYTLMHRMLKRRDVDKPDVIARVTTMLEDLVNPNSVTSMSLRYLPPLPFML